MGNKCKSCKGKGTVNWSSIYAVDPPNMTGEIRVQEISICRSCVGTGMEHTKRNIEQVAISPEDWYNNHYVSIP